MKIGTVVKETKYLKFILIKEKPKTSIYEVRSIKEEWDILATIEWYPGWRQYCIMTEIYTVWNDGCLKDVVEFLEFLREDHKSKRARRNKFIKRV